MTASHVVNVNIGRHAFLAVMQLTEKLNSDVSEAGNAAPGFFGRRQMTLFAVVPDIGGEFPIALYSLPQDKIFSGNLLR